LCRNPPTNLQREGRLGLGGAGGRCGQLRGLGRRGAVASALPRSDSSATVDVEVVGLGEDWGGGGSREEAAIVSQEAHEGVHRERTQGTSRP
jgi:hypothetical protein